MSHLIKISIAIAMVIITWNMSPVWMISDMSGYISDIRAANTDWWVKVTRSDASDTKIDLQYLAAQHMSDKKLILEQKAMIKALSDDSNTKIAKSTKKTIAKVLHTNPSYRRGSFLVNAGEKDGIKKGNLVSSYGHLVGQISEVQSSNARVELISFRHSSYVAQLANKSMLSVMGALDDVRLVGSNLSRTADVKEGDMVYLSASILAPDRPQLIIGRIHQIYSIPEEAYLTVDIQPILDLSDLDRVIIIQSDI